MKRLGSDKTKESEMGLLEKNTFFANYDYPAEI